MTAKRIYLTLPEPPSSNRYWRKYRNVMVLSDVARTYKKTAYLIARAAGMRPVKGDCAVAFTWYRKRKAGDLDNRIKIVLDALEGAAYEWDSQVVEIHAYRANDAKNPRLQISVTPIKAPNHHSEDATK